MSYSPGRHSPTRSDRKMMSPAKPTIYSNVHNGRSFNKNDLLMSPVLPIKGSSRSKPTSPNQKDVSINENQQKFLQNLNGQISTLENEFKDLMAVKEAVDNAQQQQHHHQQHGGEDFDEEKALLLEQKEQEYLQLRKDRSVTSVNFVCYCAYLFVIIVCVIYSSLRNKATN